MLVLLGWKSPTTNSDLLTALRDGGFLTTSQAALICDVSDQTIVSVIQGPRAEG
jgi:hypothetical protein